MTDRLKGRIAFCTASGAGIGRATAIAFAREGARVIATDISETRLEGLKSEGVAECVVLDVRDSAAVEAAGKRFAPVDILFNAAGLVHHGTVLEATDAEWDFAFDLNGRLDPGRAQSLRLWRDQSGRDRIDEVRGRRLHPPGRPLQRNMPGHDPIAIAR